MDLIIWLRLFCCKFDTNFITSTITYNLKIKFHTTNYIIYLQLSYNIHTNLIQYKDNIHTIQCTTIIQLYYNVDTSSNVWYSLSVTLHTNIIQPTVEVFVI